MMEYDYQFCPKCGRLVPYEIEEKYDGEYETYYCPMCGVITHNRDTNWNW